MGFSAISHCLVAVLTISFGYFQMTEQITVLGPERALPTRTPKAAIPRNDRKNEEFSPKLPQTS